MDLGKGWADLDLPVNSGLGHLKAPQSEDAERPHCQDVPVLYVALWLRLDVFPHVPVFMFTFDLEF